MKENIEIDLRELFALLLRKAWLIILCAVLIGGLALGYTVFFVTPRYRASVTLYVNNSSNRGDNLYISASDLATAQRLVTTYVTILKTDSVLQQVAQEAGLDLSPRAIKSMMSAQVLEETEVFQVQVTCADPELAARIANAIAAVAPEAISSIMEGSSAKVIDYAGVPTSRFFPSYRRNTVLGVLVGGVLAAVIVVLRMLLDTRVKSEEDLIGISDVPVLGAIPEFNTEKKGRF